MAVSNKRILLLMLCLSLLPLGFMGCAEGLFWRGGKYVPWAQNQWAEEEKIADTLFSRKRRLDLLVSSAENQPVDRQTEAAEELLKILKSDPVLLTRLHAVKLLGRLNCARSIEGLKFASGDPNSDLRIASVRSWAKLPGEVAVPQLQEMIGSDTDVDVRLAATKALSAFPGTRTVQALAIALSDPNPALQMRAAQTLGHVTGENLGKNVPAWKQYIANSLPNTPFERNERQMLADRAGAEKR